MIVPEGPSPAPEFGAATPVPAGVDARALVAALWASPGVGLAV